MKKLFKFTFRLISWAIFLALVIPIVYFAWRMGQPMDRPEYKGLTYYQYAKWEKSEQHKHWEEIGDTYRAQNPDSGLTEAGCNGTSFAINHAALLLTQGPRLMLEAKASDEPFDYVHFLPDWWASFEKEHLVALRSGPKAIFACRIPGVIPDDYALSVGAKLPEPELAGQ